MKIKKHNHIWGLVGTPEAGCSWECIQCGYTRDSEINIIGKEEICPKYSWAVMLKSNIVYFIHDCIFSIGRMVAYRGLKRIGYKIMRLAEYIVRCHLVDKKQERKSYV